MAKVVLFVADFPKLSETFILSKFLGILELGWDVHVVCWQSQPEEWRRVRGVVERAAVRRRVHVVWPHRPRGLAFLLLPFALVRCLALAPAATLTYLRRGWKRFGLDVFRRLYLDAEIILLHPDLVHIEFSALAPEHMVLKELLDCKILVSFRGYDLNFVGLEDPQHYQPVWDYADALHLLGHDLWQRAQRRGCSPEKSHFLIPPAVDTVFFSAPEREAPGNVGTPARPLRILSVGRLEWKKGYEYAFEAIRLLAEQGIACEYRVIGEGEYYEALSFASHQMGMEQTVQLLGAQPREEVRNQMGWAEVFLHAAVSEGFCNAVLEAQAMELPVVCSDAGGLPENVLDGETGFVVQRRNPKALAERLVILAHNRHLRTCMGLLGRKRVQSGFQLSDQVSSFSHLYKSVIG